MKKIFFIIPFIVLETQSCFSQTFSEMIKFMSVAFDIKEIKHLTYSTKTGNGNAAMVLENEEIYPYLRMMKDSLSDRNINVERKNDAKILFFKNLTFLSLMFKDSKIYIVCQRVMWDARDANKVMIKFNSVGVRRALLPSEFFKATVYLKLKKGKWKITRKKIIFPNKE
jgi:hypothetical protein